MPFTQVPNLSGDVQVILWFEKKNFGTSLAISPSYVHIAEPTDDTN